MNKKRKYIIIIFGLIFLLVLYDGIITIRLKEAEKLLKEEQERYTKNYLELEEITEHVKNVRDTEYTNCINEKYQDKDNTENLNKKIEELNNYFNGNYRVSVYYEDINTGFRYKYRENEVYYGASLIKLLEAMYIYDGAINGNINILDELVYTPRYKNDYSLGMDKHQYGDKLSIKLLVDYMIRYSDNGAHSMIYEYIGRDNLIKYGEEIGAKYTLYGNDSYGSQTARDTNIYLKHAYEIINSNTEYGSMLKESMMNTYYNSLYLTSEEDNNVAHKYGWYEVNYHDIGIVYDDIGIYNISVLTTYGMNDYERIVKDIHRKINELHNTFYEERKIRCKNEIYDNNI